MHSINLHIYKKRNLFHITVKYMFVITEMEVRSQCRQHCRGELQCLLPSPNVLVAVSTGMGVKTLRTQDTLDLRHFRTGAEVSVRHFGTEVSLV